MSERGGTMETVIQLSNVTKLYGSTIALNNVTLNIGTGKIIGLLGPNGSGKTTLFKTIMRIIRQQRGDIGICGVSANYETRKNISYMPDREYLYDFMTVNDAMNYYIDMFVDFDANRATELCIKLGLDKNNHIARLSKGTKEKVALMLTLSRRVPIYLLDEPLGSLDPVVKHEMLNVIKESVNSDNVIIISTHLIKDTEEILDEIIMIKNGNIAKHSDVATIRKTGKTVEEAYLEVFLNV